MGHPSPRNIEPRFAPRNLHRVTVLGTGPLDCAAGYRFKVTSHEVIDLDEGRVVSEIPRAPFAYDAAGGTGYHVVTVEQALPPGFRAPAIEALLVATTSALLVFVAVYLAPLLKVGGTRLLLATGFTRLRKEALLDNAVRDRLLEAIKEDPGVEATQLQKRVGAGWGTTVYHLTVLEKNKLVSSLVDGRYRRYFPAGGLDWSARGKVAALRNAKTRAFYDLVKEEPGLAQRDLGARMSMNGASAIWHLERLEEAGLVGRVRDGRRVRYFANAEAEVPKTYDPRDAVEVG